MNFLKRFFPQAKSKINNQNENVVFMASQFGAAAASQNTRATDAMVDGMDKFLEMADRIKDKLPATRRGHLFETIIAAKENADKAMSGSPERVFITHLEGRNQAPADLETRVGNQLVSEGQAKFSALSPNRIIKMITDPKYHGMDRYIPSDKIEGVRSEILSQLHNTNDPQKVAELQDSLNHLKNHSTDTIEVRWADRNPSLYAQVNEAKYVIDEAFRTGAGAAAAGFIISGAISSVKNGIAVFQGNKKPDEAACEVLKDSAKSGMRSGAIGVTGTGIRYAAVKANISPLTKSNVATAVAAGVIDVGITVYDFAKGEITSEVAMERIGQTGMSTMSSIYSGAVAGMVCGPAGAVVGSVAGYLISTNVYQSCLAIIKSANLAEKEAERLIALSQAACEEMVKQREEFNKTVIERLKMHETEFQECFSRIDSTLQRNNWEETVISLTQLTDFFGQKLKLVKFEEFDDYMKQENVLVL